MKFSFPSALATAISGLLLSHAPAAVLFSESFDYGGSDTVINGTGGWSVASAVLKYDADGGLDVPQMNGEAGGSMWLDFTGGARVASNGTPNFAYSGLGAGDAMWVTALVQVTTGGSFGSTLSLAGGSVSSLKLDISSAGSVSFTGTLNTTISQGFNTGLNLGDGTHQILLRATKGAGSSPVDSQIDLWLNPADTSSALGLGAADWTLDSGDGQVKWGRDTDTFTSISAGPSGQGRIDEIRVTTTFEELNLASASASVIPEPGVAILGSLGLLGLIRRRR